MRQVRSSGEFGNQWTHALAPSAEGGRCEKHCGNQPTKLGLTLYKPKHITDSFELNIKKKKKLHVKCFCNGEFPCIKRSFKYI